MPRDFRQTVTVPRDPKPPKEGVAAFLPNPSPGGWPMHLKRRNGQAVVEYGLLLALMALSVLAALGVFGAGLLHNLENTARRVARP
jgi:Flp pilus assembly pilin Flp